MHVWLITIGEPLPTEPNSRPHRAGILSKYLSNLGHQVTWWTSTFDHINKENRFNEDTSLSFEANTEINLIFGGGYQRNISFKRIRDHLKVADKFSTWSRQYSPPDVIVCSYPTIELSEEAIKYAKEFDVPIIIDIRDLWPDIFINAVPRLFKPFANFFLNLIYDKKINYIFSEAEALVGISDDYLSWALTKCSRINPSKDKIIFLGYERPKSELELVNYESVSKKYDLSSKGLKILFVGTFGSTYDLSIPIQAAIDLDSSSNPPTFIFCGSGDFEEKWKELAGESRNIIFPGWMTKDQLNELLSISDIGLACYAKDAPQSIPNKIIEYMSAGMPILSSLKGETKELLGENSCGLTYDPEDLSDFMSKLSILESYNLRGDMSKNAISLFNDNFDADKVYGEYVHYLESFVQD